MERDYSCGKNIEEITRDWETCTNFHYSIALGGCVPLVASLASYFVGLQDQGTDFFIFGVGALNHIVENFHYTVLFDKTVREVEDILRE